MPDYWTSCGYRLLTRGGDGRLTVTDDFLRSYLMRPELSPIPESCAAELALHDALLANPRRVGSAPTSWRRWPMRTRGRITASGCAFARASSAPIRSRRAYVGLFQGEGVDVPPQFVAELTQVLLRHILGDDATPMEARAAEMLFRTQKIAVTEDGAVMSADEATVELFATTAGFGSLGELLAQNKTPARSVDLDVMDDGNAAEYWDRDERHDFSVSLNRGQPALDALTRVLEKWVRHLLGVEREDLAGTRDRRRTLGMARRPRCRGERPAQRSVQSRRHRRGTDAPPAVPVPPRIRRSGGHAPGHQGPAGLSRDGHGRATSGSSSSRRTSSSTCRSRGRNDPTPDA